jgi:shikimate dehydrogenase
MSHKYAVMGNPIAHSLSPGIHQAFAKQFGFDLIYEKIRAEQDSFELEVKNFFQQEGKGLNITAPFKERAFALSEVRTTRCMTAKSANTLWMQDGLLHADNTDGVGFIRDLKQHYDLTKASVLILGAGGAARGIIEPLLESPIRCLHITNRSKERLIAIAQDFPKITTINWEQIKEQYTILINACNLSETIPSNLWLSKPFCYDLSYTSERQTPFTLLAQSKGCKAQDGYGMLVQQAAESFFVWHGKKPFNF